MQPGAHPSEQSEVTLRLRMAWHRMFGPCRWCSTKPRSVFCLPGLPRPCQNRLDICPEVPTDRGSSRAQTGSAMYRSKDKLCRGRHEKPARSPRAVLLKVAVQFMEIKRKRKGTKKCKNIFQIKRNVKTRKLCSLASAPGPLHRSVSPSMQHGGL